MLRLREVRSQQRKQQKWWEQEDKDREGLVRIWFRKNGGKVERVWVYFQSVFFFFSIKLFWSDDDYFTILWWFLLSTWTGHRYTCELPSWTPPPNLAPHPILLSCPRAPALGTPLRASNQHWSSVLHMVIYMCFNASLSNHPTLHLL